MLNPVVLLPLPLALFLLAVLAYSLLRLSTWPTYPDWASMHVSQPRHSLNSTPAPYRPRPWDEVTGDIAAAPISAPPAPPVAFDPLDHRVPLTEVELWGSIPADWYQPLTDFETQCGARPPAALREDTRELVTVA